jgi:DNA-binding HxlR family transcriptional regulator
MSLTNFAQVYAELTPNEQAQFADALRRLLADGLIWREDETDRRVYNFLVRRRDLVADYLQVAGWELHHHETIGVFQVIHRDGAHRRHLKRDETIWLLLLRLIDAELREKMTVMPTRYPVVTQSEIVQRYAEFFPGQTVRKKSSLEDALRTLASLKLVRVHRSSTSEPTVELLPILQVVIPVNDLASLAERLALYNRANDEVESKDEG